MPNREAMIIETIESITDRKYQIKESMENLRIQFKKSDDDREDKRLGLELELILRKKFSPRWTSVYFS